MAGEAGSRTPGLGRITGKAPGHLPPTLGWSQPAVSFRAVLNPLVVAGMGTTQTGDTWAITVGKEDGG